MRTRIMASLAAVALAVAGGAIALSLDGSAASAAVPSSSPARGWYIDANGIPRFLPMGSNAVPGQNGDYKGMWFKGLTLDPQVTVQKAADPSASVKREASVTVNVDFESAIPVKVTGLPAYRAGDPELWGDNTGSVPDAAADITVRRVPTSATSCTAGTASGDRSVGSTEQKFCVYPTHTSAAGVPVAGFLAGQSYKLTIWVYAP